MFLCRIDPLAPGGALNPLRTPTTRMVRPDESEVRSGIVEEKLRMFGEKSSPQRHSLWNLTTGSPTKSNIIHVSSPPPIDNSQRTQSSHALFQPVKSQRDQNENEEEDVPTRMQPPLRRPSTNVQQLTKSLSNVSKIGQRTAYQGDNKVCAPSPAFKQSRKTETKNVAG